MKKNTRKPQPLGYGNTVNAVAFRTALVQFKNDSGKNYTDEEVKKLSNDEATKVMKERLEKAIANNFDSDKYIVIAIVHSKNSASVGFPLPSNQIHSHILVKLRAKEGREHISTIMNKLAIKFRKDDPLFSDGGCESVGGSWKKYICFLKHEAQIQAHKPKYEMSDFISNLAPGEINQIIDGNVHEIDFTIDPGNDAKEKYVADLGEAYRQFLFAYYRSGNLALADGIRIKAERKAKYDYKRAVAKTQAGHTSIP